jgi:hypothetical protein
VVEIVNAMNKKSMLDRDNVELYIMSEEEEAMLAEILLEDEKFPMKEWARPNDMGLQEWQEQILKKEIGDE